MNIKKTIALSACVGVLALSGVLGIIHGGAEEKNYLAINYESKTVAAMLGEQVKLAVASPLYPDKVQEIVYSVQSPNGEFAQIENGKFHATEEGTYTVYVSVLGKDGKSDTNIYTVGITKSDAPILSKTPAIPTAFLQGFAYSVPEAMFVDYNTSVPELVEYSVYYLDENGVETELTDSFEPSISRHGASVTLKYVAYSDIGGGRIEKLYSVPVLQVYNENEYGDKLYDYNKMFITEGVSETDLTEYGAAFYGDSDFTLTYANRLSHDFEITFSTLSKLDNIDSVEIRLTDSCNSDEFIILEIYSNSLTESKVSINGGAMKTFGGSYKDVLGGLTLQYDSNVQKVYAGLDELGKVAQTALGNPFNGFSSGFVNITLQAKGVTARSALVVAMLNGHSMILDEKNDIIAPFVDTEKEVNTQALLGTTVLVPQGIGYDVISPNILSKVSITDVFGKPVTALDGTYLWEADANREYSFIAEYIGEYLFNYSVEDASGNVYNSCYYTVFVKETVCPTLALAKEIKSEVKVGEKLTIPQLSYSDNLTKNEDMHVQISIQLPKDTYVLVEEGQKFTFDSPGVYYIWFSVMDECLNMTTIERIIICK